ncbi:hypothetical protein CARUB_v10011183mg [Capsella rubella]|uniref:S-protein homolog n=1 Tax=Capsella rubella TaxID=81985 RepID=R0IK62_9BRAS|nr:S-protein homolog 5 [Capsella rubella]EOA37373.1 hypothetical protein CARUB_v10011183mg [Capsella rubella]
MGLSTKNQIFIFMRILFIIFVLKTSASLETHLSTDGLIPFAAKHVIIINKLVTQATLIVHCRNKGDDLGVIKLNWKASFDFRFRVNLRKTTTYTCSFKWPNNTATFDIFRADRDDNPKSKYGVCKECIWSIYEPAPCRDKRDGGQPQCFPWKS